MPDIHHETVFFTGHVQGVGFRYTTLQISKEFEVTGFVKNLFDGRVQVEAEGERPEVDAFVKTIEDRMHGHIRKVERSHKRCPREFTGFVIKP